MLLRDKYWPNQRPCTIDTAFFSDNVEREGGSVECADANSERALQKIGDLLSLLHTKGLLNDEDVISFIGAHRWERAE